MTFRDGLRRAWTAGLIVWSIAATLASAQDVEAPELLSRMNAAMRDLDYHGALIYQHGSRIDSLRLFHMGGENERERLVSLSGPRNEIIRAGNTVTCIQGTRVPTVFPSARQQLLPLLPDTGDERYRLSYSTRLAGTDRVAGYEARIVEIVPRDAYRYGYRLWIERDSHALLRAAMIGSDQRLLEQFMFVNLTLGAPSAADLLPSRPIDQAMTPAEEPLLRDGGRWQLGELPAGFTLSGRRRPADGGPDAEHLVISDGLVSVSVYVERRSGDSPETDVAMSRGVLSVYTRIVDPWRITALGNAPKETIEKIALSVGSVASPR